jgi:hypothetical protein
MQYIYMLIALLGAVSVFGQNTPFGFRSIESSYRKEVYDQDGTIWAHWYLADWRATTGTNLTLVDEHGFFPFSPSTNTEHIIREFYRRPIPNQGIWNGVVQTSYDVYRSFFPTSSVVTITNASTPITDYTFEWGDPPIIGKKVTIYKSSTGKQKTIETGTYIIGLTNNLYDEDTALWTFQVSDNTGALLHMHFTAAPGNGVEANFSPASVIANTGVLHPVSSVTVGAFAYGKAPRPLTQKINVAARKEEAQ